MISGPARFGRFNGCLSLDHTAVFLCGVTGLYGSVQESGVFYKWGTRLRRKVLKPLLVGRSAGRVEEGQVNLTAAVIHDATQRETSSAFGLRRRSTAACLPDSYNAISLFGTHDPAHVENVEDAAQQEPGEKSSGRCAIDLRTYI